MPLHPRGCPAFPRWSREARGLGVALPSGPGTLTGHPADAAGRPGPAGPAHFPHTPCRISEPPAASHSVPLPGKARGAWTAAHAPPELVQLGDASSKGARLVSTPACGSPQHTRLAPPLGLPCFHTRPHCRRPPSAVATRRHTRSSGPFTQRERESCQPGRQVGLGGPGPEGRGRAVP